MKYCHLIRRVFDRVGKKHEYNEFDGCVFNCCAAISLIFIVIMIILISYVTLTNAQLIANKIAYNDIYNLTTGCPLTSDKCYRYNSGHACSGNDILIAYYFFPIKNTDVSLCCFGDNSWFLDGGCFMAANLNLLIIILIIFILCVCWRFLHHFYYCFHEATEIYQDEMDLMEVKTI